MEPDFEAFARAWIARDQRLADGGVAVTGD